MGYELPSRRQVLLIRPVSVRTSIPHQSTNYTHLDKLRYGDTHEALARNDGIRLRDMEEAFHKLRPCVTADVPREHRYQDYVFTASVVCSRSGSAKDVRERQDRMREEIFGWTSTVHWNYE